MDPNKVPNYRDGVNTYPVKLIVTDFNGMAIGKVKIEGKIQYVVRWNGDISDDTDIGFPQSHGNPVWMLLAEGIRLSIDI